MTPANTNARPVTRSEALRLASLLAPMRGPREMRVRAEMLVLAYAGDDAELAMPDGRTMTMGGR